ncbi:hypothetical protein OAO87_04640 [bacterium]|nr:hypothetical protein [bacterium]
MPLGAVKEAPNRFPCVGQPCAARGVWHPVGTRCVGLRRRRARSRPTLLTREGWGLGHAGGTSAFGARHPRARRTEVTSLSSKAAETTKEAAQSKATTKRNHAFSGEGLAGQDSQRAVSLFGKLSVYRYTAALRAAARRIFRFFPLFGRPD